MDVRDGSTVVASLDRSFGEALAAGLMRRGSAARFCHAADVDGTVAGTLVIDVALNGASDRLDAAALIGTQTTRIVVLGSDVHGVLEGLDVDATVPPTASLDSLCAAVTGVDGGQRNGNAKAASDRPGRVALSVQERELLRELLAGHSTAKVAARWSVSEQSVRDHLQATCHKLGVGTRAEATAWALKAGLSPASAPQEAGA